MSVSSAFAQATGQINGVVADNSGGVVPGVTVFAVESGTGISRDTVTGANGRYSFLSLRPTSYEIRAELAGFRTVRQTDVVLQANQNLTLNITLELGELSETVTVAGQASTVDITQSTLVRSRRLEAHRRAAAQRPRRRAPQHARLGHGRHRGQSGIRQNDSGRAAPLDQRHRIAAGVVQARRHEPHGLILPAESAVPVPGRAAGILIQTSNYSAAQGASAGAVVNAVTRSGTNNFHGGAFGYARDRTFNSKNFFLPERDFLKRKQDGGYAGGPIVQQQDVLLRRMAGHEDSNVGGTLNQTIPTTAMRAGDFSAIPTQLRDPNGGVFPATRFRSAGSIRPR